MFRRMFCFALYPGCLGLFGGEEMMGMGMGIRSACR